MTDAHRAARPLHDPKTIKQLGADATMVDAALVDLERDSEISLWVLGAAMRVVRELEGNAYPDEASCLLLALEERLQNHATLLIARRHASAMLDAITARSQAIVEAAAHGGEHG